MSLLIELAINGATTLGLMGGAGWLLHRPNRRTKVVKPNGFGAYAWSDMLDKKEATFRCPKCTYHAKPQPKICQCQDYYREHYHFRCEGKDIYCCGYTCILRTQDDRD